MQTLLNNRYQVIRILGSGGFGDTYLAEDTQMPSSRRCVIKRLKPVHNNPEIYQLIQERFQREAVILEELGGAIDQIPSLYAYFQLNGEFYLVQEWIDGETLTQKVHSQGVLHESAVREILINLLPVLEYIHSKQILHRDIKPDNIIVRHHDNKPTLIDFGAVRESMGTVINSQGNPTSSIIIGTPGYMPSEQAAGRPVYSSDLYSLGLTAIYLLTGQQPQELHTDLNTGEIIWRQSALNVSPTLAQVLDRAIAYHPRDRYLNPREMLAALQTNFTPTITSPKSTLITTPQNPAFNPSYSPPVTNQNNDARGGFLGNLIVGGLIGASIIIGFAINKPNTSSTSTPQTTVQSKVVSAEISKTPEKQQNTTSSTTQPLLTQPSPITTQLQVIRPSPGQAVQNYYQTINQGQYQTAWNQLSSALQANKKKHPNGYLSYIEWWGGTVQSVDVQKVNVLDTSAETSTVTTRLTYIMKNSQRVTRSVRFSLIWDDANNKWIISDAS